MGRLMPAACPPQPAADCWLHPGLEVRTSSISGKGLFARAALPAGTVVSRLGGHLVTWAQLRELFAEAALEGRYVDTVSVADDLHLVLPPRRDNGYGNHSCDPNLWWVDAYTLAARRDIAPGEEVTNDYGTSTAVAEFHMDCACGSARCRGMVTGHDWQLPDLRKRYGDHWIPLLLDRIRSTGSEALPGSAPISVDGGHLSIPEPLRALITTTAAAELARVHNDQVVFPHRLVIDSPEDEDRRFPGWPTPVLVIADENQGVCSWGVPLGVAAPPVLVGGDLAGDAGTAIYAPDVSSFVAARRWDGTCLGREPLLQAQAAPLDEESLAYLRANFDERASTHGWPAQEQLRFERDGARILLWSGDDQCDWWLSGTGDTVLGETAARLLDLSDLRSSLWSNDIAGEALLDRLR
ncbi:SET domain-containing protein [Catellatospora sp. NPDC049111]|uniref:SET domain-containing protein n=1 Tax=Catellatospora sp. NPDC049111 TaxID=3155271 RepID=UPI0033DE2E11